jgi:regulator of PEP synthase PpsR (kinase-PPPase family)
MGSNPPPAAKIAIRDELDRDRTEKAALIGLLLDAVHMTAFRRRRVKRLDSRQPNRGTGSEIIQ